MPSLRILLTTSGLLVCSNLFMTVAWYGHLKHLRDRPVLVAALISWGIALFEYLLQVPANRIGSGAMSLPQLKVLQEIITLVVFAGFSISYMKVPITRNYVLAGMLLAGAAFLIFSERRGQ